VLTLSDIDCSYLYYNCITTPILNTSSDPLLYCNSHVSPVTCSKNCTMSFLLVYSSKHT